MLHCGDLSDIQWNCLKLRPESSGRIGKPDVAARSGRVSTLSAIATSENIEELSVQQLEQLLAKKRLSIEKTELGKGTSSTTKCKTMEEVEMTTVSLPLLRKPIWR